MFKNFIKSLLKQYLEEEFNFSRVTYSHDGEIKKSTEPKKISDGHWVNINSFNGNQLEIEHIRSMSNLKGKTTFEIVREDMEINENIKLRMNNKKIQGKVILD